jgi:molecular chaperone GrpE
MLKNEENRVSQSDDRGDQPQNKWEKVVPREEREKEQAPTELQEEAAPEVAEYSYEELLMLYKEAKAKSEQHWDQFIRSEAEFKNFQNRVEKRIAETHKFAAEKILTDLLPVMDSLEQGLQQSHQDLTDAVKGMREGMELTLKMLDNVLNRFGVTSVNPLNETYDPHLHEALTMQEVAGVKSGQVITVIQKGYTLHGRVIRPARVIVAK